LPAYRVVVVEHTGHRQGVAKRATFQLDPETYDEPDASPWRRAISTAVIRPDVGGMRIDSDILDTAPLPAVVNLAAGVDVAAPVLVAILDALVSDSRHSVNIDDIKVVVSQLGPRLAALDTLDVTQRAVAQAALSAEILKRCTTIEASAR
jgi:hypothetical protein